MNIQIIWEKYNQRLKSYIILQTKDDVLADDLLQEVYLKVDKGLGSIKDDQRISSWLYQVTKNVIIDHYRANKKVHHEYRDELFVDPTPNISNHPSQQLSDCLLPIIKELPEDYREAVYLSEIKCHSQKEVAKMIGLSYSGAKSKIQRGRLMIKKLLTSCCSIELNSKNSIVDFEKNTNTKDYCK
ncbi:MAG TPA: RNA polymerase sigma factor SigZ [Gammaproteobacteria bacterium]|nr:RNA polymerase sigma factor SigZ [Gammaproteobacteria bacterium]